MAAKGSVPAILLAALIVAGGPWDTSFAYEVGGARFSESVPVGGTDLVLKGAGILRYKVVFRGYAVALYLPPGTPEAAALSGVAKRLEFEYFWSIPGPEFGKAAEPILRRNAGERVVASLRERIDRMNRHYRDIKPGDRYVLTYVPGRGTELSLNGTPLVTIEGDDFAGAYFAIWLGPEPIDRELKDKLLGAV